MKLKTLGSRARPSARARRRRAEREATVHSGRPEPQPRVWSLLLPPRYPSERR
jgi:hypothetical protein